MCAVCLYNDVHGCSLCVPVCSVYDVSCVFVPRRELVQRVCDEVNTAGERVADF